MEGISLATIQEKELISNNALTQQKESDDTSVSQNIAKQDKVVISEEAREKLETDIQQSPVPEQELNSEDMLRHTLSSEGANKKNIHTGAFNIQFFFGTTQEQQEDTLDHLKEQLTPQSYSLAELLGKYRNADSSGITEVLTSSTKSYDEMLLDQIQKSEAQDVDDSSEKSLNKNLQFQFNVKLNTYI